MKSENILAVCLLFAISGAAFAQWPQINTQGSPVCNEALRVAHATFHSDSFYLFAPPSIPEGIESALVMQPQALDISGGNGLLGDASVFEKIPFDSRSVYWQKQAHYGKRLVLAERAFGWRGDRYSLLYIGDNVDAGVFIQSYEPGSRAGNYQIILDDVGRPPLIFKNLNSSNLWAIDVGADYIPLDGWKVYSEGATGFSYECTIRFGPENKVGVSLLPLPVSKMEDILSHMTGPDTGMGTYRPVSELMKMVEYGWSNAALRPWALSGETYNTREEVDTELQAWSKQRVTNFRSYNQYLKQYPFAQRSLSSYYRHSFGLSPQSADAMAAFVLDVIVRSHFVFHREHDSENPAPINPWRNGLIPQQE